MRKIDFNSIVLQTDSSSPSLNLPVIPTFRDIANLVECMAMFYFIKGLSVCRIVTEPCAHRFLLLGGLSVALHHALDVGGFRGREDCLMLLRGEWIIASMARRNTSLAL